MSIATLNIIKNIVGAAGEVVTTAAIPVKNYAKEGYFSVQYHISAGTLKLEYLICSTIDGTYLEPAAASDIGSGLSNRGFISFNPILAPFMKLRATFTGGGTLNLFLNIQ